MPFRLDLDEGDQLEGKDIYVMILLATQWPEGVSPRGLVLALLHVGTGVRTLQHSQEVIRGHAMEER
eukprot:4404896-Alexandrium_andersonii.AAC.1